MLSISTILVDKITQLLSSLERLNHPGCSRGSPLQSAREQHDHVNSLKRHHQKQQLAGHVKQHLSSYFLEHFPLGFILFFSPLLICLYRCPASGAHVMSTWTTWTFHLIHNCIRFCKHILFVAWSGQHCWKISNEMQPPT